MLARTSWIFQTACLEIVYHDKRPGRPGDKAKSSSEYCLRCISAIPGYLNIVIGLYLARNNDAFGAG
jgi:hypothetical protein